MIPITFIEETKLFNDSYLNSLICHYMTFYWKVCKNFLDYIEDSMSNDSLIESTISTRCKKNGLCNSKISFPSVLSHETNRSKVSEKANPHDFYSRNSIMNFYPNQTLMVIGTMLRSNLKKIRIMQVNNYIRIPTSLVPL
jgi:hypothetical protein